MAKAIITITDLDLDDGTVITDIQVMDCPNDDGEVTMAHIFAKFMAENMNDAAFLTQVYDFATDLMNHLPSANNDSENDEAAVAA